MVHGIPVGVNPTTYIYTVSEPLSSLRQVGAEAPVDALHHDGPYGIGLPSDSRYVFGVRPTTRLKVLAK